MHHVVSLHACRCCRVNSHRQSWRRRLNAHQSSIARMATLEGEGWAPSTSRSVVSPCITSQSTTEQCLYQLCLTSVCVAGAGCLILYHSGVHCASLSIRSEATQRFPTLGKELSQGFKTAIRGYFNRVTPRGISGCETVEHTDRLARSCRALNRKFPPARLNLTTKRAPGFSGAKQKEEKPYCYF